MLLKALVAFSGGWSLVPAGNQSQDPTAPGDGRSCQPQPNTLWGFQGSEMSWRERLAQGNLKKAFVRLFVL